MNILLKIGSQSVLLPNMTGVESVMRVLSKGIPVWDRTYNTPPILELDPEKNLPVEMKVLPPGIRFVKRGEGDVEVEVFPERSDLRSARKTKLLKG